MNSRKLFAAATACALALAFTTHGSARKQTASKTTQTSHSRIAPAQSPEVQSVVDEAARAALKKFADKKLAENQLAITVIDLRDPDHPLQGSFRGNERIYPASVVKLFYLAYAHRLMEDGKLRETDELKRALSDMIVFSYNDATGYVLDLLTDTTSGKELPDAEMKAWQYKRDAVNRYYASLGYANINTNQKTFCEDAYGREHFSRGPLLRSAARGKGRRECDGGDGGEKIPAAHLIRLAKAVMTMAFEKSMKNAPTTGT